MQRLFPFGTDACITFLYEGGFRIGEVGQVQWQNIRIDRHGVIVNINFKISELFGSRLMSPDKNMAGTVIQGDGMTDRRVSSDDANGSLSDLVLCRPYHGYTAVGGGGV